MSETNWTFSTDILSAGSVARGVTAGTDKPSGGGSFTYAFNSLAAVVGGVTLYNNETNFAPTAANKGGRISGAMKRAPSGGNIGFSTFLFIGGQGISVNDNAYMLGISDDEPGVIQLRKGAMSAGLPSDVVGSSGILALGTTGYANDTWLHLRLDMIVNGTGDVVLVAAQNDLGSNPVTAPIWTAIPGLSDFTDDVLGINSGSVPYTNGRFGFGFECADVSRRAYFDAIGVERQL